MKKRTFGLSLALSLLLLSGCGKSEAVKTTEELIDNISPIVTADCKEDIDNAANAYELLTSEEKNKIKDFDKLSYYIAAEDSIQSTLAYNEQIDIFNKEAEKVNSANSEFKEYLDEIQSSGIYDAKAYDPETITKLRKATSDAEVAMVDDFEMKSPLEVIDGEDISKAKSDELSQKAEDLLNKVTELQNNTQSLIDETASISVPDYSEVKEKIEKKWNKAKDSVAIQEQITAPEEAFVISRLLELEGISDVQPVTEDNDPNGSLHKEGGYTAQVFFRIPTITDVYGEGTIDIGTDGGGSIEVYETEEYANKRNDYLSGFAGSWIGVGSHHVLGTMIVRTSDKFTATEQNEWEAKIIKKMTESRK